MQAPNLKNTSLLVLCGGAGTRMGGQDKPLLKWHGVPMVDRVLGSVPEDVPKVISANRNLAVYRQRGTVVSDAESGLADFQGPLVGVLSGLSNLSSEWLLVAPGDVPGLPTNWWRAMFAAAVDCHAVVAHDGTRQQHLHLLLHQSLGPHLRQYLSRGRYEVYRWLDELQPAIAEFKEPSAFTNINYLSDLA